MSSSAPKNPSLNEAPDRANRPGLFEPQVTWCLEQVADSPAYPYRNRGVFVVHGIGAMDRTNGTSVDLRYGFEDAADELRPRDAKDKLRVGVAWKDVPATYIKEGYWGNYRNVEAAFPELIASMPPSSQSYFKAMWNVRTRSAFRTGWWLFLQALRLVGVSLRNLFSSALFKRPFYTLGRPPIYVLIVLLVILTIPLLLMLPWGRKALADVVGDVRLYIDPDGAIEHAMAQWIDKRVAALLLQMFGLDLDFEELPDTEPAPVAKPSPPPVASAAHAALKLQINLPAGAPTDGSPVSADVTGLTVNCAEPEKPETRATGLPSYKLQMDGKPLRFEQVVWVSHSLGTLVSYNVLGDLLRRSVELAAGEVKDKDGKRLAEEVRLRRLANANRVLNSIHRFYTLGSPLQKVAFLFPGVLRRWPECDWLKTQRANASAPATGEKRWWVNFFHILDPVSGIPTDPALFGDIPRSVHSPSKTTLPGLAHIGYWHESRIARFILHQTHLPADGATMPPWEQTPAPLPDPGALWKVYWNGVMIVSMLAAVIVLLGTWWGVVGHYLDWLAKNIPEPLQSWLLAGLHWLGGVLSAVYGRIYDWLYY